MGDTEFQCTEVKKYLAVYVDEEVKFHWHNIAFAVSRAIMMLQLIKMFSCLDEDTLPRLYKALVRSHLEFGYLISTLTDGQISNGKVQHGAKRLLPHLKHLSYGEQLVVMRRWQGDRIQVYKIINRIDSTQDST